MDVSGVGFREAADLGGRVGWLPIFLYPFSMRGGRGGIPASFPSRSPPPKQPFQPTPTPSPGFHQEKNRNLSLGGFLREKGPRPVVGARAPSPLETWPTGPWGLDRHSHGSLPASRVFNFFLRLKRMGPGLKTLGCYHNPQSADLGGRWMVSEGGAL